MLIKFKNKYYSIFKYKYKEINVEFSCEDNELKIRSYKYDDVLTSYRKFFGSIGNPKKGYTRDMTTHKSKMLISNYLRTLDLFKI